MIRSVSSIQNQCAPNSTDVCYGSSKIVSFLCAQRSRTVCSVKSTESPTMSAQEPVCSCDVCKCFHQSYPGTTDGLGTRCKLGDRVKVWNRRTGVVTFIGSVNFRQNVSVILVGIVMDTPLTPAFLAGYDLYCSNSRRILVPPRFVTALGPGKPGAPQVKGFQLTPNGGVIKANRRKFKKCDPLVYKLLFGR
ncbi:unnamed protein product [Calicophoron daubneyi]|uniref:Uncharacterized protein n=1 Tax=Calicophoron daubneyi TaxID=300641 RepID=A0AAV2TX94_CALDB